MDSKLFSASNTLKLHEEREQQVGIRSTVPASMVKGWVNPIFRGQRPIRNGSAVHRHRTNAMLVSCMLSMSEKYSYERYIRENKTFLANRTTCRSAASNQWLTDPCSFGNRREKYSNGLSHARLLS